MTCFFCFQGLRWIRISCHLQEAAACYQYEGWTRMFVTLAGTDTQYLIDMLEEMFGKGPMIDPEELMTADVKAKFDVAHAEEVTFAKTTGELDPAKGTVVHPKSLPISLDFGIDSELYPENITHTEKSTKSGKMVDKFY